MPRSIRGKLFAAYVIITILVSIAIAYNLYVRYQGRLEIVQAQQLRDSKVASRFVEYLINHISLHQKMVSRNLLQGQFDNNSREIKARGVLPNLIITRKNREILVSSFNSNSLPAIGIIRSNQITTGPYQKWNGLAGIPVVTTFNFDKKTYRLITFVKRSEFEKLLPLNLLGGSKFSVFDRRGLPIYSQAKKIIPPSEVTIKSNLNKLFLNNYDEIGVLRKVPNTDLTISVFQPYQGAISPAVRTLVSSLYTFFPLLAVIFVIGVIFTKRILEPLSKLSNDAGKLADNLERPVEAYSKTTEVETLAGSLEHLRLRVKKHLDELQIKNVNLRTMENETTALHQTVSLKDRCRKIAQSSAKLTEADASIITIIDTRKLKDFLSQTFNLPLGIKILIKNKKDCKQKLEKLKRYLNISNTEKQGIESLTKLGFYSALALKFDIGNGLVAILEVFSRKVNHFSRERIKLLRHFSKSVTLALLNAVLYRNQKYSKEFVESVLENLPVATAVLSCPRLEVIKVNSLYEKHFGKTVVSKEKVINKSVFSALPALENNLIRPVVKRMLSSKQPAFFKEVDFKFLTKKDDFWNIGIIPILENDKVHNLVVSLQECTEEVKMRKRLEELVKKQEEHSHQLETILSSLQCGLVITDQEGKVKHCNTRYKEILECDNNKLENIELSNQNFQNSDGKVIDDQNRPENRILRKPFLQEAYSCKTLKGNVKYLNINGAALRDVDSNSIGGVFTVEDMTTFMKIQEKLKENLIKSKEWQDKLKSLKKASLELSKINDIDKILETAGKASCQLSDSNIVSAYTLTDDQKGIDKFYIGIPADYPHQCQADVSKFEVCFHGCLYSKCLREGKPQIINDPENYQEKKDLPEGHVPLKGLLVLPLISPLGKVIGLLYVSDKKGGQKYTVEDKNIVHSLAVHASAAIVNAYNYQREHRIAQVLQSSLLPILPNFPEIDFDYAYEAATSGAMVGGDFFDVLELKDGKIGLVIADVAGKGIEAATTTSTIKNTIRAFAHEDLSPGDILTRTNRVIYNQGIPSFVTAIMAVLDTNMGKLVYANAGHHPPVLFKERLGSAIFLQKGSTPLGVLKQELYEDFGADLNLSDTLLFYTDGLVEARRGKEFFGEERLIKCVLKHCHHRRPVNLILKEVEKFSNKRFTDDIAVLSLKLQQLKRDRDQLNFRLGRLFHN